MQEQSRVSKSCLKAELCFHRFVSFACVPIYCKGEITSKQNMIKIKTMYYCKWKLFDLIQSVPPYLSNLYFLQHTENI